jgi:hypothetical protein
MSRASSSTRRSCATSRARATPTRRRSTTARCTPSSATRSRAGTARTTSTSRSPASRRRWTSAPSASAGRRSTAKAVLQQESGKVHAAVVQQAIASGDYKYAQEWFNEHKADVDLPTAKVLEKAVEDGTQKELANGYRSEYLANESSPPALEDLRKRVLGDKTSTTRRNVLVGQIQNRRAALERRADLERERSCARSSAASASSTPTRSPASSRRRAVRAVHRRGEGHGGRAAGEGGDRACRRHAHVQEPAAGGAGAPALRSRGRRARGPDEVRPQGGGRLALDLRRAAAPGEGDPVTFAVRQGIVDAAGAARSYRAVEDRRRARRALRDRARHAARSTTRRSSRSPSRRRTSCARC